MFSPSLKSTVWRANLFETTSECFSEREVFVFEQVLLLISMEVQEFNIPGLLRPKNDKIKFSVV